MPKLRIRPDYGILIANAAIRRPVGASVRIDQRLNNMKRFKVFVPVFCAAALFVGCAKKPGDSTAPDIEADLENPDVVFDESPMYDLFQKVDGILSEGKTNEATRVFADALEDPSFGRFRVQMFSTFLRYLLFVGDIEGAKSRFLSALRTESDTAMPSRDLIYGYLLEKGDAEGALDWARVLTAQDLPLDVRGAASEWLASGYLSAGNSEGALEAINAAIVDLPASVAAPMALRFAQSALSRKDVTLAEGIAKAMSARAEQPEYGASVRSLELKIYAAKGDFQSAIAAIPGLVGVLQDNQFAQGLGELFRAAEAAGKSEDVDKMAETVIRDERFSTLPMSRLAAARRWISGVVDGNVETQAQYPVRFNELMKMGMPTSQLTSIFSRNFYKILDNTQVLAEMSSMLKVLCEQTTGSENESLKSFALDTAFILEDYDAALAIIDGGVADRDASWHSMTRAKILAHKAMAAGNAAEAVARFREFMDLLPDEEQHDPTSGISFSRAMIVANNEKRIGDIWKSAGEQEKAAAAYSAARAGYAAALQGNTAGEETASYIKDQMRALDEVFAPESEAQPTNSPAAPVSPAPSAGPAEAGSAATEEITPAQESQQ